MIKKTINSLKKRIKELNALLIGASKTLVLGDSHGGVFEYMYDRNLLLPHIINAEIVGGATAYGLYNDRSSTKAFLRFKNSMQRFNDFDTILIQLGEVDCAFTLWKKASKTQEAEKLIPLSMRGYKRLLDEIVSNHKQKKVVLTGAVLPTIKDGQKAPKEAALRDKIEVSLIERTRLVLAFNEELKKIAALYGFDYFDITDETLDDATGVIMEEFVVKERVDHHHDFEKSSVVWANKFRAHIGGAI